MGVFDQASHYTLKSNPAAFFTWLARRFVDNFVFLGWLDTTTIAFPGEPDRICDTVAEFAPRSGEGPRCLLDVEFQSEPHPDMLERVGEYTYRLRREARYGAGQAGKYRVIAVVLNLTGPPQARELDMRSADLNGAGAWLRVVQVTFAEEEAATILPRIASEELSRGMLPWIPLMRGGGDAGIIDEWRRLALTEPSSQRRSDYGGLARVFAGLGGCQQVWDQALKGWNMRESEAVLEWQREAETERLRRDILRLLELRHHQGVPADLAAIVTVSSDLEELSHWFDFAVTTENLDAFRAAIGNAESSGGSFSSGNGA